MSLNKTPVFGSTPGYAAAIASSANTALDGTGTLYPIFTAGADGAIVTSLRAMARATVTITACRLFVSTDGGSTKNFVDEKLMGAYTVTVTSAQTPVVFVNKVNPDEAMRLPGNSILYASIAVALSGGIVFAAEYTSLTQA